MVIPDPLTCTEKPNSGEVAPEHNPLYWQKEKYTPLETRHTSNPEWGGRDAPIHSKLDRKGEKYTYKTVHETVRLLVVSWYSIQQRELSLSHCFQSD